MTIVPGPTLGLEEVDAPHAEMLSLADTLAAAVRSRQAREALSILDTLIEVTARHFAQEDEWMDRTAYPDRVAHRAAHDLFLQDLHGSSLTLRSAGVTSAVLQWATRRLPQWIRYHIERNDRPLVAHLRRTTPRRASSPPAHPRS